MFRLIKRTMLGALLIGGFFLAAPQTHSASANDYWSNYWSWYDGSYRPYYRNYYRYYRPYYPGYRYDRYRNSYYDRFDRFDRFDYGPRESYRIGPLRIERWY